jgi:hypothetical protein
MPQWHDNNPGVCIACFLTTQGREVIILFAAAAALWTPGPVWNPGLFRLSLPAAACIASWRLILGLTSPLFRGRQRSSCRLHSWLITTPRLKVGGGNEQQQQPILNLNHQGRRAIIPVHTPGVGEEEEEEEVCDA